jgi:hypothetical protein
MVIYFIGQIFIDHMVSKATRPENDLIKYKSNDINNNVNMNDSIGDLLRRKLKNELYFDSYSGKYSIPLLDNRLAAAILKSIRVYDYECEKEIKRLKGQEDSSTFYLK